MNHCTGGLSEREIEHYNGSHISERTVLFTTVQTEQSKQT